jgi:hypothetical protein
LEIQVRLLKFITRANWILFGAASLVGLLVAPFDFALGIIFGGIIVTINFHLLYRTLKRSFKPPHLASVSSILAKYYVRFVISGIIIFVLIAKNVVNPIGLFFGLSVVVASIILATILECTKLIFKEAV